jgi:hypothetical protein
MSGKSTNTRPARRGPIAGARPSLDQIVGRQLAVGPGTILLVVVDSGGEIDEPVGSGTKVDCDSIMDAVVEVLTGAGQALPLADASPMTLAKAATLKIDVRILSNSLKCETNALEENRNKGKEEGNKPRK